MSWSLLQCPVSGEDDRLHSVEILVEQVPVLLTPKISHTLLNSQLDAAHQLSCLELLVCDLPILDSSVAELLALYDAVFGLVGGPVTVGPGHNSGLGPQHAVLQVLWLLSLVDCYHCGHDDCWVQSNILM